MATRFVTVVHARAEHLEPGDIIRFMDDGDWANDISLGGWLRVSSQVSLVGNDGVHIPVEDFAGANATAERRRWSVVQVQLP